MNKGGEGAKAESTPPSKFPAPQTSPFVGVRKPVLKRRQTQKKPAKTPAKSDAKQGPESKTTVKKNSTITG